MDKDTPTSEDQQAPQNQTGADLNPLQQELEETKRKLEEMTVISQRALADLQNFKRRNEEEKAAFTTFANAALFNELIPVIESASRALEHKTKNEEWIKGSEQTLKLLIQTSEKLGLTQVPVDGPFDPTMHEALMTAPGAQDTILEVLEKGYMLKDKVIKMARVKVGNGQKESPKETTQ